MPFRRLHGHFSSRAAVCRGMPFCPCCSRVDLPLTADLCWFCVGSKCPGQPPTSSPRRTPHGAGGRHEHAFVPVPPPHQVRRRAIAAAHLDDHAFPVPIAHVTAVDHNLITCDRAHSASFSPGEGAQEVPRRAGGRSRRGADRQMRRLVLDTRHSISSPTPVPGCWTSAGLAGWPGRSSRCAKQRE